MASIVAHAAVPFLARTKWPLDRRETIAAVICATWPDLDFASLLFEVRPEDMFGHRGFTHSILAAAIVSVLAAVVLRKRSLVPLLFAIALSHGLLDALTAGEIGVALFAPVSNFRVRSPFCLFASCPGGIDEYFGSWGALTIANELLFFVIPLALVLQPRTRRTAIAGAAWLVTAISLRVSQPSMFAAHMPRAIAHVDPKELANIPHEAALVTKLEDMRAYFDRDLAPEIVPWSSSFFPAWYGGWSGRWQDGTPKLVWRTLFGVETITEADARARIVRGDLFGLAPSEKLDIALARFDFPITKQGLARNHNASPKPRYWNGMCQGVGAAALAMNEPFRSVDVIGLDGTRVRFHPNDIKALLVTAYRDPGIVVIGDVCSTLAFDEVAACGMNPAVLAIALVNRLGIARRSFLIDAVPGIAKQYYPIASARLHMTSSTDIEMDLVLSSTILSYTRVSKENERVGLVPVRVKYRAKLALEDGDVVGGAWTGDAAPDDMLVVGDKPLLVHGDRAKGAFQIPWSVVRAIARASADESAPPEIDLRNVSAD